MLTTTKKTNIKLSIILTLMLIIINLNSKNSYAQNNLYNSIKIEKIYAKCINTNHIGSLTNCKFVDNTVYVPYKNKITLIKNNKIIWKKIFKNTITSGIIANKQLAILITKNKNLIAIDNYTGSIKWKIKLEDKLTFLIKATNDTIYISTHDDKIIALDSSNGKKIWHSSINTIQPSILGTHTLIKSKNTLYNISYNGKITAINQKFGNILWVKDMLGSQYSTEYKQSLNAIKTIIFYNKILYTLNYNGNLTAIKINTKEILWKKTFKSKVNILKTNDNILIVKKTGKIKLLNKDNGELIWKNNNLTTKKLTNPIFLNKLNATIISDENGTLYLIKNDNKITEIKEKISISSKIKKLQKTNKENIYVLSKNGKIIYIKIKV
ncbi:MAG TPA: PQQ-binding-like beta-propeller repeat protein [Candidatus Azoamicus sp. OHIO1]